ncbi:transcription elongation factor, mitochondrial [Hyperolius riggenbachi]|uniref:transcription elongation factor, mitochondrial n=1 Tax=Hyperolius riggenbachi TaxID=752182 RepID=UPI0035A3C6ED
MLGSLRVALAAFCGYRSHRGKHLMRPCLVASLQQHLVHYSHTVEGMDNPKEVDSVVHDVDGNIEKSYTPQQRAIILQLLNTATESQLGCVKQLQGEKSASIVQFREQHGPFQDLNALRKVKHFQPNFIQKTCDSILRLTRRIEQNVIARFLKPDVPLHRLQAAESVVSIVFGLKKFAWVHVDRTMTVRDWQEQDCCCFLKGKHVPELYLEDISSVVSKLPQADFYILEKPSLTLQKTALFPAVLHMRTVEAMLYCLLNPQLAEGSGHRVFSMARNTVGKHFKIMLAESRTSGVEVVERLINEAVLVPKPRVNFTPEIIKQYRHHLQPRGQNRHEEMCDTLLQAIAFYELSFF